jgi:asparagine synthase (glutamine-hydrolysing)
LLASGIVDRKLNTAALPGYLSTGSVQEPATIIAGVNALPPGMVQRISFADGRPRYHQPQNFVEHDSRSSTNMGLREGALAVRAALSDSVAHHLLSDVPVGVFLSGGIDSAAVVALCAEQGSEPVNTFTITFNEAKYSEADRARSLAERFGTSHHEVRLSGSDLLDVLPEVFAGMDQPTLDGVNTFLVSRAVRAFGIKVVLSGLGGDELFAGYPSFRRAHAAQPAWQAPAFIRRLAGNMISAIPHADASKLKSMLMAHSPAEGAYTASRTLFDNANVAALLSQKTSGLPETAGAAGHFERDELSSLSLLQQVSHLELSHYMRNTLLRDSDTFSMAHNLELRVPFVD